MGKIKGIRENGFNPNIKSGCLVKLVEVRTSWPGLTDIKKNDSILSHPKHVLLIQVKPHCTVVNGYLDV